MEKTDKTMIIEPIGQVRNDFIDEIPEGYEKLPSEIEVAPDYSEALFKIEENSHIVVVFWMDRIKRQNKTLKLHPKGRDDLPLVGIFATRSPVRPNPIGIRAVRLVKRKENILEVLGLDALNKSPVLDIKPYSLKHDFVKDAESPRWAKHLREEKR
jgi:tRNA-Thr(GGU) m(6)t(6)A37 methyltransferase TsaA